MPAWPSVVCALLPRPNTRGCRSTEQPLARTSRTRAPVSRRPIRWAETSVADPPSGRTAARTRVSRSSGVSVVLLSSHSSGPSQTARPVPVGTQVLGAVGRSTPSAADASGPAARSRTSVIATNGSTVMPAASGRRSKAVLHARRGCLAWSGWVRSSSAIATGSFRIDQHRAGDLDRDEGAVDGDVDGVADARPAPFDQGEGEGAGQLGAAVAGGDVAEHGHRRGRQ